MQSSNQVTIYNFLACSLFNNMALIQNDIKKYNNLFFPLSFLEKVLIVRITIMRAQYRWIDGKKSLGCSKWIQALWIMSWDIWTKFIAEFAGPQISDRWVKEAYEVWFFFNRGTFHRLYRKHLYNDPRKILKSFLKRIS